MPIELLDMKAVARLADVAEQTVRWWRSTGQMPEEDVTLGQSPGWFPETIERWLRERTR